SLARRTPGATDNTSPRSRRSGGLRPPCSGPARPKHRPAATSRRSLQACIASLPLQSSLMSKTYLKSDHFNGGGSTVPLRTTIGPYTVTVQAQDAVTNAIATTVVPIQVVACTPITTCPPKGFFGLCGPISDGCGGTVNCGMCDANLLCSSSHCCASDS